MTRRTGYDGQPHRWGVIAQCHDPYREFCYCELCKRYMETGRAHDGTFTKTFFNALLISLKSTNPMYEPDSKVLLLGH
jgi:hypothetical protein